MPDSSAGKRNTKWTALLAALLVAYAVFRFASCDAGRGGMSDANLNSSPVTGPQPTGQAAAMPTPRVAPALDPVDDRSEEGIRLNIQQANKSITYEHLKKNAERYDGEPWAFTGRVSQIQESGGQTIALVSLDLWGSKTLYVRAKFTTEFVEKDQVYVVGYLAGNYSYTSVAGWSLTVPAIDARAILKPAEVNRIKASRAAQKK